MRAETLGDQAQLDRRWRPALMSFFLRRIHDCAEAEDLTQEVFARLLGSSGTATSSPEAYIFQVAANLLTDRARRMSVRAAYRERLGLIDGSGVELLDPHRVATGRAALATLAAKLQDLPERTRTIFILYRLENMSLDTIAEGFGISKSAVKKHVTKAMAFLMIQMRDSR